MEWYIVGIGLLGLLMLFISIGIPIPFALVGASLPFLWTIQDFNTSLMSNQLQLWRTWIDYILLSVPIFIFLGELIAKSNEYGMQTFDQALFKLIQARAISLEEGLKHADSENDLRLQIKLHGNKSASDLLPGSLNLTLEENEKTNHLFKKLR